MIAGSGKRISKKKLTKNSPLFRSHRFTKSQQDIFLPFVEKGTITLIGATTENPSFRINSALLSRCRVLTLEKLSLQDGMDRMIRRASRIKWRDVLDMAREHMTAPELMECTRTLALDDKSIDQWADGTLEDGAIKWLIDLSDGDGKAFGYFYIRTWSILRSQAPMKACGANLFENCPYNHDI